MLKYIMDLKELSQYSILAFILTIFIYPICSSTHLGSSCDFFPLFGGILGLFVPLGLLLILGVSVLTSFVFLSLKRKGVLQSIENEKIRYAILFLFAWVIFAIIIYIISFYLSGNSYLFFPTMIE